jgi:metallophosphoesterase superfamily enzyme
VVVSGPGLQRERLPCFLVRPRVTVLPAFGSFTGMASVMPQPEDHAFVIAGGEVLPMS